MGRNYFELIIFKVIYLNDNFFDYQHYFIL